MSSGDITVSQLKAGRVLERIVLRLVRHWAARNIKKGRQLMGIDLLFVDEKSVGLHAFISVANMPLFEDSLKDGSVYLISGFDVVRGNDKYRVTDFHLTMRFNPATSLIPTEEPPAKIPKQIFRIRTIDELQTLAKTNRDLPDVVGQVCSTKVFHDGISLKRMLVHLQMDSGVEVKFTAFDDEAITLAKHLKDKEADFCIMVATNVNPRIFSDVLYLNATAGTRFFFNDEVDVTRDLMERLRTTDTLERYRSVQKIEHMSIAEINDFILTAKSQEIEYICTAKIIGIQGGRGWSFISCSVCGKKLHMEESSLVCKNCTGPATVGDVKYRVEMVVEDNTARAVFVVFDGEMQKLTNIAASDLTAEMVDGQMYASEAEPMPAVITDLIGKTYAFHIRLADFNFGPYHESYSVSRVFKDENDAPAPNFDEKGGAVASMPRAEEYEGLETLPASSSQTIDVMKKKQKLC